MAWYDEHFERQPSRDPIRRLHSSTRSTGKNGKRKVWCKMCLNKRTSHGTDNILLDAEPTSGPGELWNLSRAEGGPMEYRLCNCLTHLRDCALQTPDVRDRARAEHVKRNLAPRRVPRASRDAREACPAPVLDGDHGLAQHAAPSQQHSAFPLPSEDNRSTSLQHVMPSPYAAENTTLHDPRLQPPSAWSNTEYRTNSVMPFPGSQGYWSYGAMWTSEGFPSSYAAENLSPVPMQAPLELALHSEQPAFGLGLGAEPAASFQDVAAIFGGTNQSSELLVRDSCAF
ncbi:hypothetical protein PsYK624_148170 [Phanerochaete sordida]|uniref:Uncharacterized protein n=1 Tax=Phanerochaete sordida TaxID=48140 RepID=A0A9P3GSI2_9APHY|nr:hypothetical protein PsYK624_148170 [Phanerochaete sordida]